MSEKGQVRAESDDEKSDPGATLPTSQKEGALPLSLFLLFRSLQPVSLDPQLSLYYCYCSSAVTPFFFPLALASSALCIVAFTPKST